MDDEITLLRRAGGRVRGPSSATKARARLTLNGEFPRRRRPNRFALLAAAAALLLGAVAAPWFLRPETSQPPGPTGADQRVVLLEALADVQGRIDHVKDRLADDASIIGSEDLQIRLRDLRGQRRQICTQLAPEARPRVCDRAI